MDKKWEKGSPRFWGLWKKKEKLLTIHFSNVKGAKDKDIMKNKKHC